ncbi:BURP domain protein RD22-like [Manihot esculenta]|uniref:BURP domain protein RD22-like n=1 Tax=Manihot esculenta TaxID=3983 RepID=UPI001CC74884|nr:BURP domain protein RD22-like [Manihot esculenta]
MWYGKRYEQPFAEDTPNTQMWYGKRYEQTFAENTPNTQMWYGKRYEQPFAEDTPNTQMWYGKRYKQPFAEDTPNTQMWYGKRYEQPFAEDTTDRRQKYGRRYELKFNKHALSNSTVFFLPNDLHAEIKKRFSVDPESRQGKMLKQTIENCESPRIKGEDKFCPTSLESLVDFSVKHVGNKAQVLMNEIDKPKREQEYTIKEVKFIGENHVVCHKLQYPYAVYYCHALKGTKVYTAQVVGADGTKAKAVAVCHTDTSAWNPGHLAFLVLKMKPGEGTACHFIRSDTFVMVSN